jgi:hypothetical protein
MRQRASRELHCMGCSSLLNNLQSNCTKIGNWLIGKKLKNFPSPPHAAQGKVERLQEWVTGSL